MGRETVHRLFSRIGGRLDIGMTEPENRVTDLVFSSPMLDIDLEIESVLVDEAPDILDPATLDGHGKLHFIERDIDHGEIEYGVDVHGMDTGVQATREEFLDAYSRPEELYMVSDPEGFDPDYFELDLLKRLSDPLEIDGATSGRGFVEGEYFSGELDYISTDERDLLMMESPGLEEGCSYRFYGELDVEGFSGRQEGVFYFEPWQQEALETV